MFVKPNTKVRDPISKRHLPDAGAEVPETTYWLRRLRGGDVSLATNPETLVTHNLDSISSEND